MYIIENKSEESRAIQKNAEKHVPTAQFKDNRSQNETEKGMTAQLEKKENLTGMPDNLKEGIESLSGFSMDDVRVHYNSSKPATVQALAYTQGTDIHVAPGQEKCLPHEAWHVAQQMAGRVSPTTNINGMPVNDNAALEHEADVMGEKAVQCKEMGFENTFSLGKNNVELIPIQRKIEVDKLTWNDNSEKIIELMRNKFKSNYLVNILINAVFLKMPNQVRDDFFEKEVDQLDKDDFLNTFILWLGEWGKSEEGKNSEGMIYTYKYTNDDGSLNKLIKDVFKYHFFKHYGWRIIGVGEYMTGDSTGLGIAAALDPTITLKILPYWAPQTKKTPTFMEGGALDPKKIDTRFENSTRREDSLSKEHAPVLFRPLYDSSQIRISGLKKKENARREAVAEVVLKIKSNQELWNMLKDAEKLDVLLEALDDSKVRSNNVAALSQNKLKLKKKVDEKKMKIDKDEFVKAVCLSCGILTTLNDITSPEAILTALEDVRIIFEICEKIKQKMKDKIKSNIIEDKIQLPPELLTQTQIDQEREFQKLNPGNPNDVYRRRFVAAGRSSKAAPIKPWNMETYEATRIIGEKYGEKKEEIKPLLLPSDEEVKKKVCDFKATMFRKNGIEGKKCILLWQRLSGQKGGAHKELDSHPIILKRIAKMISDNFKDRVIILIGDDSMHISDLKSYGVTNTIVEFNEYWNNPDFKDLKNDRNNQNYFLQLLSDENDAISIGMRSGSLESSALLGIKTIFIDDLGNNAEDRMEFWAGNAAYGREHHLIDESFEWNLSGPIPNYKRLATSNCFTTSERYIFPYLDAIEQLAQNYCNFDKCLFFDEAKVVEKLGSIFESLKKDIENIKIQCSQIADYLEKIREGQKFIRIGEKFIRIGLNEVGRAYIEYGQTKIKINKPYEISMLRQNENGTYSIASEALEKLYKELLDELWENHDINKTKGDILGKINEFRKYMEEWVISDNELDQLAGLLSFWINSEKESAAEGTDKESRS